VLYRFRFIAEETISIWDGFLFVYIISSQDLVLGEQPEEEMNSRGGFQTPDYRGVYRFYPSEIYDLVKGLRRIHPI
jgi:hypothetical protein